MEDLLRRQRQEQRDLQSRITQKKKSASKKTRKGVNDECDELERELKTRHEQERISLAKDDPVENEASKSDSAAKGSTLEDDILASFTKQLPKEEEILQQKTEQLLIKPTNGSGETSIASNQQVSKQNRQKARLARRAAEQEAATVKAAEEAASLPDLKKRERDRMNEQFKQHRLVEKEIAANGHCLYSAVADQMRRLGRSLDPDSPGPAPPEASADNRDVGRVNDYKAVRKAAARYIEKNQDDFTPFLEEPVDEYIDKIENTGEWGGQLELMALAKSYAININVLQGDGRIEKIEGAVSEDKSETWLAYYRHGFGLGEHYNSLRKDDIA